MFSSNTSQVSSDAVYVEDVFSNFLYTGNGSTQTITNGIDEAGKGALTWIKQRSTAGGHQLYDTARGATQLLSSSNTNAQSTFAAGLTSFNADGFSLGNGINCNTSGETYASWTFRKQPKFFDVVTYTGDGVSGRTIAHSLGSAPGCVMIKSTSDAFAWYVYHQSLGAGNFLNLNLTDAATASEAMFGPGNPAPSSTVITLGNSNATNGNGKTYVAYLFAHNAGGFGLTGTDNVISCGSFAHNFSGATVNLGWEPQWVLVKAANQANDWYVFDNMRGIATGGDDAALFPNLSNAENLNSWGIDLTATGFTVSFNNILSSGNAIYIAIRRGPMKTPTSGTSVFAPVARAGTSADATVSAGFPPDSLLVKNRGGSNSSVDWSFNFFDKLRSPGYRLSTAFTNAEDTSVNFITSFDQNGVTLPATGYTATNGSGYNYINYFFRRAPGFFDEVCYTGNGGSRTVAHNLGVAPELMIIKSRSSASYQWIVYCSYLTAPTTSILCLNLNIARDTGYTNFFDSTAPSASVITLGAGSSVNNSGDTYVSYLFASCPGVSKVGSYTGNGGTQTINCGFTGGARFVMIKRTDSTGDWYVWDTARGIVSANDPRLSLNSTAAEVTTDDSIDPDNSGFIVNQVSATNINVSSATYIYLAIA